MNTFTKDEQYKIIDMYENGVDIDENTVVLETCGNKSSLLFLSWMYQNAPFCMKRKYQKYLYFKEKYLSKK